MIMIITPSADRNGVQNLLNVNSRFKALNDKKDDSSGSSTQIDSNSVGSFIIDNLTSSNLPLTERITSIQTDISNGQTQQNGLEDISSALSDLQEAVASGSSEDVEGALAAINAAVEQAIFEDESLLEDFSVSGLSLLAEDGSVDSSALESAVEKVETSQTELTGKHENLEFELRSLEVSRENALSATGLVRDSSFANELLSMTNTQLSDQESLADGFGNLNFQSVMELLK